MNGLTLGGGQSVRAKVCGLKTADAVSAALEGGAGWLGFVFFPKSPRHVTAAEAAALAEAARGRAQIVAVMVDPDDVLLDAVARTLRPDLIQLHGCESPQRAAAVSAQTAAGVIKALPVSQAADLDAAALYEPVVDALMFDARPPAGSALPGGVGVRFDSTILAGRRFSRPWFLAGGLGADTVVAAARAAGAARVDVSSGVETAPGVKDAALIAAFLDAVRRA